MTTDSLSPLAKRVKALRTQKQLTLRELSEKSGASYSNLSKVETGKLSPTYDTIVRLAAGFDISVTELLSFDGTPNSQKRRSITRKGDGTLHETKHYSYEMLCAEVADKKLVPFMATIHNQDITQFGPLTTHSGEEVLYVLSGQVEVHTEDREPVLLEAGDCMFFDSSLGHGCISKGEEDAKVFWVHLS